MATFFGQQSQTGTDAPGFPIILWSSANYACPGSGNQNIQELSIFAFGSTATFRMGIYTTAGILVAEATAAATITGASLAWQGHMTQASVKAAGGASPGVLVGGTSYKIAVSMAGGGSITHGKSDGVNSNYNLTDYTGGMPTNLPSASTLNFLYCWRCGVDPAAGANTDIQPGTMLKGT